MKILIKFSIAFFVLTSCINKKVHEELLNLKIQEINKAFENGNIEVFNNLVSVESVQQLLKDIIDENIPREIGQHRILKIEQGIAYVLITGKFSFGNSGDETNYSSDYSGVYLFEKSEDEWRLKEKIQIDRSNQILHHDLSIEVNPGANLKVNDVLTLNIKDNIGFVVKLNHKSRISNLYLNKQKVDYVFDGGILWVDVKKTDNQKLLIEYNIDVEQDNEDRNSSYFGNQFGHIRNQYFWHPFYDFSSPNDRAYFNVKCKIPAEYQLATSLPQTEVIDGDFRIIEAISPNPTFALSMYYDKEWNVRELKKGDMKLILYATDGFTPDKETLYKEFSQTFDILEKEFGKPQINYFGVVQDRSNGGNGWKNRSNNIIVAAENGSFLKKIDVNPRAVFGHEVAHSWTNPIGPATNFLSEGWATYAESILLSKEPGKEIVSKFYEFQKKRYQNGNYNGNNSIWEDYSNSGISYNKGAWLFYMLEHLLGEKKFYKALSNFMQSKNHTIDSFIENVNEMSEEDIRPLIEVWLKSKEIPNVSITQHKNKVTIEQTGDIFIFPLEILFTTKNGESFIRKKDIYEKKHLINLDESEIGTYTIDPKNKLLLQKE